MYLYFRYLVGMVCCLWPGCQALWAQVFPIQVSPQLTPPYSVYLSDYLAPPQERLQVILLLRDLTQASLDIQLRFRLELDGQTILQSRAGLAPISLQGGVPRILSGAELAPYLAPENLEYLHGFSSQDYTGSLALPEGSYRLCFQAFDANRPDLALSSEGCRFYFLSKSEPPLPNLPLCGKQVPELMPQQILFSWLPRQTHSPNALDQTEYIFRLYEIRPPGRDPNDAAFGSLPVYEVSTGLTQLVYGLSEPALIPGMEYAWHVQAVDGSGRDAFRNEGRSEVCTFFYGFSTEGEESLGAIRDLRARVFNSFRANVYWTAQPGRYARYRLEYRPRGQAEWYPALWAESPELDSLELWNLYPNQSYEVRLQGETAEGYRGPFTPIIQLDTPVREPFECGEPKPLSPWDLGNLPPPLLNAQVNQIIDMGGFEMQLASVERLPSPGWYRGKAWVRIPLFGNARGAAGFERAYLSEDGKLVKGEVHIIRGSTLAFAAETSDRDLEEIFAARRETNRANWEHLDLPPQSFHYTPWDIQEIIFDPDTGEIQIILENGAVLPPEETPRPAFDNAQETEVIEDKNGDQWVVEKDGKVHAAKGGGLRPEVPSLNGPSQDYLRQALAQIREYNTPKGSRPFKKEMENVASGLDQIIRKQRKPYEDSKPFVPRQAGVFLGETPLKKPLSQVGAAYKEKEYTYNRAWLIEQLTNPKLSEEDLGFLASLLRFEGKFFGEYIERARIQALPQEEIIQNIAQESLKLIKQILDEKIYPSSY